MDIQDFLGSQGETFTNCLPNFSIKHPYEGSGYLFNPVLYVLPHAIPSQPRVAHDVAGARNCGSDTGRKAAGGPDDGEGDAAVSAGMETPDNVNF
jgi:hypothetical protein